MFWGRSAAPSARDNQPPCRIHCQGFSGLCYSGAAFYSYINIELAFFIVIFINNFDKIVSFDIPLVCKDWSKVCICTIKYDKLALLNFFLEFIMLHIPCILGVTNRVIVSWMLILNILKSQSDFCNQRRMMQDTLKFIFYFCYLNCLYKFMSVRSFYRFGDLIK